ncbi:hypothetical protein JOC75_002582 [Metabacillus crassostreae]|uniref:hypothetical protein n=1 Tax=Metabacillus crassostreae TaxID=929098 RepID=UPI00195E90EA|nr:hypothetical protein [Metabacillus crassostreae]MBM7604579.1 hypothetical protein [Metabacillus crassostreae]
MNRANVILILLISILIAGCQNSAEVVTGEVSEKLEYDESWLTVNGTEIRDKLVIVENGEEMDLTFEEGHKAILIDTSLHTGDIELDHTNFSIESEAEADITPYEALPSNEDFEYLEKDRVINFNKSSTGTLEGNLLFSFSEEEIKNNKNTLVMEFEGVKFRVPLKLN